MKRVICLVLILMLLITGCSTIKERKNSYDYENLETIDIEYQKNTSSLIKPALYFVQKGTGKLTAELHTIVIEANENPVKKIIQELLVGPNDPALASIAPAGVIVEYVEVSVDVANVYLYSRNPIKHADHSYVTTVIPLPWWAMLGRFSITRRLSTTFQCAGASFSATNSAIEVTVFIIDLMLYLWLTLVLHN